MAWRGSRRSGPEIRACAAGGCPRVAPGAVVAVYCGLRQGALEALPQSGNIEFHQRRHCMKRITLAVSLALFASAAFAHNCPNEMKAIDAALPNAKLTAAQSA